MTLMDLLLLLLVIAAAVAVYFFFVKSRDEGTETPRKAKNLDGAKKSAKALSAAAVSRRCTSIRSSLPRRLPRTANLPTLISSSSAGSAFCA